MTSTCPVCTFENPGGLSCGMCGTAFADPAHVVSDDEWICTDCTYVNESDSKICEVCTTERVVAPVQAVVAPVQAVAQDVKIDFPDSVYASDNDMDAAINSFMIRCYNNIYGANNLTPRELTAVLERFVGVCKANQCPQMVCSYLLSRIAERYAKNPARDVINPIMNDVLCRLMYV